MLLSMVSETLHSLGHFFIHSFTLQHCLRACCELKKELNFSERAMTIQRKVGRLVDNFVLGPHDWNLQRYTDSSLDFSYAAQGVGPYL